MAFAEALARSDWPAAYAMLARAVRDKLQPSDLERQFNEMTGYWDKPATSVELGPVDSDWAYVAIYSESESYGTVQEAVDVHLIHDNGRWAINEIVWGRP